MLSRHCKVLILFTTVTLQTAMVSDSAKAGPILDWLFRRQTAYYPFAGASCDPCSPTVCQKTVVRYLPQTCYRTSWKRIPTTVYRPVTSCDPCTGCPVTCMKPCTTYSWQAQRVPYTTYRPVYQTMMVTTPSCPTAACGTTPTVVGSPALPSAGCYGCSTPSYSSVPSAIPSTTFPSTPTFPSTTIPPTSVSPSPIPANQPPSLAPNGIQGSLQGSKGGRFVFTPPGGFKTTPPRPIGNPLTTPRATGAVKPVPDPDAVNNQLKLFPAAPKLLDPRDKTARAWPVRRAWAYTPAKAEMPNSVIREPARQVQVQNHSAQPIANEPQSSASGWRTIRSN